MNRRKFIRGATSGAGAALFSPLLQFTCCSEKKNPPPNILLIVGDDHGYADMSCTGLADDVRTPNFDRLAASGVRFTQAYATSPICSPSRAGLITGCYHERWGTWWYGGPGLHNPKYKTIAEVLKEKGYATGYVGKVHYGADDSDTSHRSFPRNHGFDYYFGHTSARKHYLIHKQEKEDAFLKAKREHDRKGQSLRQQPLWENFEKVNVEAYTTEIFGDKAREFIDNNKNAPFFLQLSFNAVHNFTHQLPKKYLQEKKLKGYHDWDPKTEDYYEWYKAGRKPNNPEGREHYLGQLYYLDKELGKVLDHLAECGLTENTLVIYIGDNGGSTPIYADNTPLRGSKYLLYEGGVRVPLIFSFPGKYENGAVYDNVISAMDVLPTICNAVGVESPDYIDGLNLSPLLQGEDSTTHHEQLVWDTGHEIAVRSGKWKMHIALGDGHAKYEMVDLELGEFLYDLENDPGETINVKDAHPDVYQALKNIHTDWKRYVAPDQLKNK